MDEIKKYLNEKIEYLEKRLKYINERDKTNTDYILLGRLEAYYDSLDTIERLLQ